MRLNYDGMQQAQPAQPQQAGPIRARRRAPQPMDPAGQMQQPGDAGMDSSGGEMSNRMPAQPPVQSYRQPSPQATDPRRQQMQGAQQTYRARSVVTGQPLPSAGAPSGEMSVQGGPQYGSQGETMPQDGAVRLGGGTPVSYATTTAPVRNPALDAKYIGRSKGKQWYLGADGKQYTNVDREKAIETEQGQQQDALTGDWQTELAGDKTRQGQSQGWLESGVQGLQTARGRLAGYRPDATTAFDPSALETFDPTELRNYNTDRLDNFRSDATEGVDTGMLDNWQPSALTKVNTGALKGYDAGGTMRSYLERSGAAQPISVQAGTSGYDPRAAVEEYARGASSSAKQTLMDALEKTTNSAAAGGRLDSGLLDKDKGTVITRVGEDLNNQIAQQAVNAAQIRASIENANSGNITQAAVAQGQLAGQQAGYRSAEARDAANIGADALTSALGIDADTAKAIDSNRLTAATNSTDARLRRAGTIDSNRLTATTAASNNNLTRASGIDSLRQKSVDSATGMRLDRAKSMDANTLQALVASGQLSQAEAELYNTMNQSNLDRTGNRISSERDRIQGQQNFNTVQKSQNKQAKRDMWGNIIGTVAKGAAAYAGGQ